MVSALERAWSERAQQITTSLEHIAQTRQSGGSPERDELDGSLRRWPGYLGSRYGEGTRVLGVGNVHRGFRSKRFSPVGSRQYTPAHGRAVDEAIRAADELADSPTPLTDDAVEGYLRGIRPMYELGLSGSWTVGDVFRAGLEVYVPWTPEDIRRIAYVNVSCCQMPERERTERNGEVTRLIQHQCLEAHPLTTLVALLEPDVILCCSSAGYEQLRRSQPPAAPVVFFSQRMGDRRLGADLTIGERHLRAGAKKEIWTAALAEHVAGPADKAPRRSKGGSG
jgi:hypothetical protein